MTDANRQVNTTVTVTFDLAGQPSFAYSGDCVSRSGDFRWPQRGKGVDVTLTVTSSDPSVRYSSSMPMGLAPQGSLPSGQCPTTFLGGTEFTWGGVATSNTVLTFTDNNQDSATYVYALYFQRGNGSGGSAFAADPKIINRD